MFRNFLPALGVGLILFTACTESNPIDISGVTTESNDIAESENSTGIQLKDSTKGPVIDNVNLSAANPVSSASTVVATSSTSQAPTTSSAAAFTPRQLTEAELAVIDSILSSLNENAGFSQNPDSINSAITSASSTAYSFKTLGQTYYEGPSQCSVQLHEDEKGVQLLLSGKRGSFSETSIVLEDKNVLLRIANKHYWKDDNMTECVLDSIDFRRICEIQSGVFRNYRKGNGCGSAGGALQIACAMPMPENTVASKLLIDEADLYKQKCASEPLIDPSCIIVIQETTEDTMTNNTVCAE